MMININKLINNGIINVIINILFIFEGFKG
jgi:hypothetical protein